MAIDPTVVTDDVATRGVFKATDKIDIRGEELTELKFHHNLKFYGRNREK